MVEKKNFDDPDDVVRPWDKVTIQRVGVMGRMLPRVTVEPGWTWKDFAQPVIGRERCPVLHVKMFFSGRFAVAYEDGTQEELVAGDVAVIQPGHDAWVVGNEPVVFVDLAELFSPPA